MTRLQPENSISLYRGSSLTLALAVTRSDTSAAVDLTGSRIVLSVKDDASDRVPLVQKDSAAGASEVEITNAVGGLAHIYLVPADTQNLEPKLYVFDVWAVLADGTRHPVIPPSTLEILEAVTVLP